MPTLLDIPRLDRTKVWVLTWIPVSGGYREMFTACEGLDPADAEVIRVQAAFGTPSDVFLRCGNCGVQANPIRLLAGVATCCPKCFTVYTLEVVE